MEGIGGILAFCATGLGPVAAAAGLLGAVPAWVAWGRPNAEKLEEEEGRVVG